MALGLSSPRYELTFRERLAQDGYGVADVTYPRSSGGQVAAVLLGGQNPTSAVVVCAHATGNDKFFPLLAIYRDLLASGVAVFAFDLDGHGRDSTHVLNPDAAHTMLPQALTEVRRLMPGKPIHLMGQSFGALLVMRQMAAPVGDPAGIRSVILISPPVTGDITSRPVWFEGRSVLNKSYLRAQRDYGGFGLLPAVGPFKRGQYPLRLPPGYKNWNVMSYAGLIDQLVARWQPEASFDPNQVPTLLIYGSRDALTPPEQAELLASRPCCQCGHGTLDVAEQRMPRQAAQWLAQRTQRIGTRQGIQAKT